MYHRKEQTLHKKSASKKYEDKHWDNKVNHTEINMCQGEEIKLLCTSVLKCHND